MTILRILWKTGPATVRQVHEELNSLGAGKKVGYTTALKFMQVMHEKGLLSRTLDGVSHVYTPTISEEASDGTEETEEAAPQEPSQRDLQRLYRDFSITQPQQEETFWGTENQVTVSWGSSQPIKEGMRVVLYVNGQGQEAPASGTITLRFDRGEHQVNAVLRDARNRRIAATETVTFFVKQHSVNFNQPAAAPRN